MWWYLLTQPRLAANPGPGGSSSRLNRTPVRTHPKIDPVTDIRQPDPKNPLETPVFPLRDADATQQVRGCDLVVHGRDRTAPTMKQCLLPLLPATLIL